MILILTPYCFVAKCNVNATICTIQSNLITARVWKNHKVNCGFVARCNVDATIRQAVTSAVKAKKESLVLAMLSSFQNNKKIKTLTDTGDIIEHAIYRNGLYKTTKFNLNYI